MKATESARLNVSIHPEKDPALFELLSTISNKDARARRLLNLATFGLMFERGQLQFQSAVGQPAAATTITQPAVTTNHSSIQSNRDDIEHISKNTNMDIGEDELHDLEGIFSKGH